MTTQLVGALTILAPLSQAAGADPGPVLGRLVADGARTGVGGMIRYERGVGR